MRYAYIGSAITRKDDPKDLLRQVLDFDGKRVRGELAPIDWEWLLADIRECLGRPIGERP